LKVGEPSPSPYCPELQHWVFATGAVRNPTVNLSPAQKQKAPEQSPGPISSARDEIRISLGTFSVALVIDYYLVTTWPFRQFSH